jgi:hypothetical protein
VAQLVGGEGHRAPGLVGDVAIALPDPKLLLVGAGAEGLVPGVVHVQARDQPQPGVGQDSGSRRGEPGGVLVGVAAGGARLLVAERGEQGRFDGDEGLAAHLVVPVVDVGVPIGVEHDRVEAERARVTDPHSGAEHQLGEEPAVRVAPARQVLADLDHDVGGQPARLQRRHPRVVRRVDRRGARQLGCPVLVVAQPAQKHRDRAGLVPDGGRGQRLGAQPGQCDSNAARVSRATECAAWPVAAR